MTATATYATVARHYFDAGWAPLPLPPRAKQSPPPGFTGRQGRHPNAEDIDRWRTSHSAGNLALRLDDDTIGVDIDLYKNGDARQQLETLIGCELPETWSTSSRDDGSGILLYQAPALPHGKRWQHAPVPGVEIIQRGHRYALAWPSIHPEGRQYRWTEPSGEPADRLPQYDDLAELPYAAAAALIEDDPDHTTRDAVHVQLTGGEPSATVAAKLEEGLQACTGAQGARHDTVRDIVGRLVRQADRGEPGVNAAVEQLRARFVDAVAPDRPGGPRAAEREYRDLVAGAIHLVATTENQEQKVERMVDEWFAEIGVTAEPVAAHPPEQAVNDTDDHLIQPVNWAELWSKDSSPEWEYEDVLAKGRGHALYASRKTGKSLFFLWACAGMIVTREDVEVIYLDYEMTDDDLRERLEDMGYGPDSDLSRFHYFMLPALAPLDTHAGATELLAIVDRIISRNPQRSFVLILDTTSRAVEGEENSNDTIRAFYRHTGVRLKQRGITWARLDHAGKDASRGQRGASAKGDDVDIVWKLEATDNGYTLRRDAARMGWVPEKVTFRRVDEPHLHFVAVDDDWPAGTQEVAKLLDNLGVTLNASVRETMRLLREGGNGRRQTIVQAALKWRRQKAETGWL